MTNSAKAIRKLNTVKKHLIDCKELVNRTESNQLQRLINMIDYLKEFIELDSGK